MGGRRDLLFLCGFFRETISLRPSDAGRERKRVGVGGREGEREREREREREGG